MTTVFIFIAVLAVLVFVHELGHFSVAKWFDMRVDEFGIGFPPRATSYKPTDSETTYSLNWLPLGGFVKIFGEDGNVKDDPEHPSYGRSFGDKPWYAQVTVLAAGVIMNMILAWVLFSITFMVGTLALSEEESQNLSEVGTVITEVQEASPAATAGLMPGDKVTAVKEVGASTSSATVTPAYLQNVVEKAGTSSLVISLQRQKELVTATVTPAITETGEPRIGIAMTEAGILQLPFFPALAQGAEITAAITEQTVIGFYNLLHDAVSGGGASLQQVAGPVGIADLVGDAADRGWAPLLSFTALISVNLAILNLLPFPALDGGRIVISIVEAVRRKKIPTYVNGLINGIGMAILLLLMILITYQDITRLL